MDVANDDVYDEKSFWFDLNTLYGLLVCFPDQQKKGVENLQSFFQIKKDKYRTWKSKKNPEQIRR